MLFRRNHRKAQFGAFCLGGGGSARRNGSKAPSAWSLNGFRWSARMDRAQATSWRRSARAVSRGAQPVPRQRQRQRPACARGRRGGLGSAITHTYTD